MNNKQVAKEPLFHISKRTNIVWWKACLIRAIAILLASSICISLSCIVAKKSPIVAISDIFEGNFGLGLVWDTIYYVAILLGISLAVTPAFKMKFWNIGADGQALMGCLGCAICSQYLGGKIPEPLLIVIMLVVSITFGAIWAVIPALFKAKWNTNETLFTLMMNYIATQITMFFLYQWITTGSTWKFNYGIIPFFINDYFICILVIAILTVISHVYLRHSKQGFEISIVGESQNTAKYIGINVKKVIIRTLIISGAICGLMGFLIINVDKQLTSLTIGGRGFTAIIVAWLAKFNPLYMIFASFLVVFSDQGISNFLSKSGFRNGSFGDIIIGLLFLFIIGCEFFISYQIKFKKRIKNTKEDK